MDCEKQINLICIKLIKLIAKRLKDEIKYGEPDIDEIINYINELNDIKNILST